MPKNLPSLKPKQLIKILEKGGCKFYREGKGDHSLYTREVEEVRRIVPIDMGAKEMSPAYVLRIFRQFGFTDEEIEELLK
ncbi:MAG: type II toxin-antitoxin system HicA family toxin [Nostocaceae cyanobacterium]|nr:type II toxin-antitoxin system HicA family toxin [Nostocaceae cyanobacterium]